MEMLSDPLFWTGLGQITLINIVLSGDNAVVIALAARSLPAHQQKKAVMWGAGAAVTGSCAAIASWLRSRHRCSRSAARRRRTASRVECRAHRAATQSCEIGRAHV